MLLATHWQRRALARSSESSNSLSASRQFSSRKLKLIGADSAKHMWLEEVKTQQDWLSKECGYTKSQSLWLDPGAM